MGARIVPERAIKRLPANVDPPSNATVSPGLNEVAFTRAIVRHGVRWQPGKR
jgi:hypothetical protein